MKSILPLLLVSLASCASAPPSPAPADLGPAQAGPAPAPRPRPQSERPRAALYVGQRSLDGGDYAPVEDQVALGLEFSQEVPGSLLGWELGLMGSYDLDRVGGSDIESSTFELYGGLRKTLARGDSPVRPYLGGGLSLISVRFEAFGSDDADSSLAGYAHAGVEIEVSHAMSVGIDLRGLFGSDINLFGVDTDADYGQLTVFLALSL